MIQKESRMEVADNSGAKVAMVIGVLGKSTARGRKTRLLMGVGDTVVCTVKKALPNSDVKTGDKVRAFEGPLMFNFCIIFNIIDVNGSPIDFAIK